jgi:hypothetical protein
MPSGTFNAYAAASADFRAFSAVLAAVFADIRAVNAVAAKADVAAFKAGVRRSRADTAGTFNAHAATAATSEHSLQCSPQLPLTLHNQRNSRSSYKRRPQVKAFARCIRGTLPPEQSAHQLQPRHRHLANRAVFAAAFAKGFAFIAPVAVFRTGCRIQGSARRIRGSCGAILTIASGAAHVVAFAAGIRRNPGKSMRIRCR